MSHMQNEDRRKEPGKYQMAITTGSWVKGVIVVGLASALFILRDIFLILLTSIIIASAIEPAAAWAKRKGVPRIPSVIFIYLLTAIMLAGLFYFLFLPLLGEVSNFITSFPDYAASFANSGGLGGFFDSSGIFGGGGEAPIVDIVGQINNLLISFSQGVFSSVSMAFGGVLSLALIIVLSFYLAVQEDGVGKFLRVVTPLKSEEYVINLWKRSQTKIGLWMQGQMLLAAIVMVLVYLGLVLIGVEHALLLAVAAGVFEIIPIFGPILAAIPAVLVAFAADGMGTALMVVGLFLVIQQFENQLIYPLVVKKVVGVPPMVSILALLVGAKLAGFLGILIAVPMAAILMELLDDMEKEKVATLSKIRNSS